MAVQTRSVPVAIQPEAPTRRGRLVLWSVLGGLFVCIMWSFTFVDSVIGDNVANSLLGYDAKETAITGGVMGAIFAFVSGLAGTFTACNIAAFSAIAPLMDQKRSIGSRIGGAAKPLGWLTLGMATVAGLYGAIGAAVGPGLPQLSEEMIGAYPVRLLQSTLVFGIIGLALLYMGLATVKAVPDPLARLYARHPRAQLVIMGALIGGFLIGRPFPLFFKLFQYAASTHNIFLGAGTFVLQSLGNVLLVFLLFLVLALATRGRFQRWLEAKPGRIQAFTASALIIAGVFTFTYWVFRVPSLFGYGWWPTAPWWS
jgi:cytochrome c biogenesis protein CcdA